MKKIVSLLLVFVMLLSFISVLSSCKDKDGSNIQAENPVVCSARIDGSFVAGQTNPKLAITLSNTSASEKLTEDMFTLDGSFKHLNVTNVSGSGNNIHLTTEGQIIASSSCSGIVKLDANATISDMELRAEIPVELRSAYIDENTYKYTNAAVSFDVVLTTDTFQTATPNITIEDHTATVIAVSDDYTRATMSVALKGNSMDEKMARLSGKTVTVAADSAASGDAYTMSVAIARASVNAYVDYIANLENAYTAELYLYVSNGTASLVKEDIAFYGDFAGASVSSLEKVSDNEYRAVVMLPADDLDKEYELNGELSVAAGKLTSAWESSNPEAVYCNLYYTNAANKGETLDSIMAFVAEHKSVFDTISNVGSAVSGIAGVFSGAQTILQICGVLETTDDRLDKINQQLELLNATMNEINEKIGNLSGQMTAQLVAVSEQNYQTLAISSQAGWTTFANDHLNKLTSTINQYNSAYNDALLYYIYNADEYKLVIYKDAEGNITIPNSNSEKKNIDIVGAKIVSAEPIVLGQALPDIEAKLMKYKGRVYPDIMDDIKEVLSDSYEKALLEEYVQALILELSYKAVQKVGAQNMVETFVNFCYSLAGSTNGLKPPKAAVTPIDNYINLLSVFYNFESEAATDVEAMQAHLLTLLLKGKVLATLASGYAPNLDYDTTNSYLWAVDEVNSACALHNLEAGYKEYCYVTSSPLQHKHSGIRMQIHHFLGNDNHSGKEPLVNESQLMIMQNRWHRLYKGGNTSYDTFEKYLKAHFDETIQKRFLTKHYEMKSYTADNSITLECIYSKGSYFDTGKKYTIGSSGDRNAKYFSELKKAVGMTYNIEARTTNDLICAVAEYYEDQWYWMFTTSEKAWLVSPDPDWTWENQREYSFSILIVG